MKKLKMNLKHCYGIKNLQEELVFGNRSFAIYAPNGVMKTSFAKTLDDYSKGKETKDLAFPDRQNTRELLIDGIPLAQENVFVIESYNSDYISDKMSTLLANKELKESYDSIHKDIDKSKESLIKKLKQLSGLTGRKDNIEGIISSIFGLAFYDFILQKEDEIIKSSQLPFHHINYQIIFNDKVLEFLKSDDIKQSITEYIEKYDELVEKSPYLGKNFKFHHAENIQKQLQSQNYFKAGHSVNLFDGAAKTEFASDEEFETLLESEKKKVFNNDDLLNKFQDIKKKLKNKELEEFRDYISDNKDVLPELSKIQDFAKKIWLAYFVNQKELFSELVRKYKEGQSEIKKLIKQASEEKTDWEEVIRIFNTRFSHLPFHLEVRNKEDVILKSEVETIEFIFTEGDRKTSFSNKDDLLKILSMGEKRALYILNIIFEIEARKKTQQQTLLVVDDIADSFDYKNKYAIIEYLKYISDIEYFFMIILTHNFDFFRTVESRKITTYKQCQIAVKNNDGIKLLPMKGIKNPFINDWKQDLANRKKLIASIPFVRNLIEYKDGYDNDDYLLLTSILHCKEKTSEITLAQIKEIFERNLNNISFPSDTLQEKIIDTIFKEAEECLSADEGINLENKIVLSIAIRLKAEQFMKSKITNEESLRSIENNSMQTWSLLKAYQEEFNNESVNIEILKRVNLITPENIHINSFMYEPILDMGDNELSWTPSVGQKRYRLKRESCQLSFH